MWLVEDFSIKHLSAIVSSEIGQEVSIISISTDPFGPYFEVNDKGEKIEGSDFERVVIDWSEHGEGFGTDIHSGFFTWNCENGWLTLEFEFGEGDYDEGNIAMFDWASLQED